jgi:molybdopterin synthase sulfur carrier subunit
VKKIKIRYFAILRDLSKKNEEEIQTQAATAEELYEELGQRYANLLPQRMVRVAINDQFSEMNRMISDGDRIAFIPPVAGG